MNLLSLRTCIEKDRLFSVVLWPAASKHLSDLPRFDQTMPGENNDTSSYDLIQFGSTCCMSNSH